MCVRARVPFIHKSRRTGLCKEPCVEMRVWMCVRMCGCARDPTSLSSLILNPARPMMQPA